MATIIDVANLASVHPSTASRVLRNDPQGRASPETRRRIHWAARELRYRPNSLASGLRTRRTQTIALLMPYLDNVGFVEILEGIHAAAREARQLILHAVVEDPTDEAFFDQLVREGRVDGLLAAFGTVNDPLIRRLASEAIPMVLVNRRVRGVPGSITVRDEEASSLAAATLLDLGHRAIAHIAGAANTDTARRRRAGFEAAVDKRGLPVHRSLIVSGEYSIDGGRAAMGRILRKATVQPTAVHAADLYSAFGALDAIRAAGLRVPEDISVIALNDHVLASLTNPPLTTVHMPYRTMGARAVEMLMDAIAGKPTRSDVVVEAPELRLRGSLARL